MKRLPEGTSSLLDFEATDDDLMPIDKTSKNDLRIVIGNGRYLFNFMRWYQSGRGRETDCWREFYEELVAPGILPGDIFGYVSTRHLRRHVTPVSFSNHVQKYERLIAEIYELIPTADQEAALRRLQKTASSEYIFATEDQIRREGVIPGQPTKRKISTTSSWIL